jgi:hypothetical protein
MVNCFVDLTCTLHDHYLRIHTAHAGTYSDRKSVYKDDGAKGVGADKARRTVAPTSTVPYTEDGVFYVGDPLAWGYELAPEDG